MSSPQPIQTQVLPGHRIELYMPDIPVGETVDVLVTSTQSRQSALEVLDRLPVGSRSTQDIDRYLQEERDAWEP